MTAPMLRVLTLSTLFPNAAQPTLGVFVERQTLGLAAREDVELEVVSPIGLPPWPLSRHPHYRARADLPAREEWRGLTVHRPHFRIWPGLGHGGTARAMAAATLPLLRDIRTRFAFDLIDAEFFWPDGPAAMLLAQALDMPFSIKARGADIHHWGRQGATAAQVLKAGMRADGLLAVSEALRRDMVALGMPAAKIVVHHTGIDKDKFAPIDRVAAKTELGLAGPLIVTAGALIPRKNQLLSIEIAARIPDATLILVGEGPDRPALEAAIAARGLGGRVHLLGNRPHDEIARLLAAADVMLLASRSEGLANVWVEALACGTPIVIADIGGAREVLDRPEAGRIVAPEPEAMVGAVRAILADPPAPEAVRRATERFSWERNSEALFAHLSRLSAERH